MPEEAYQRYHEEKARGGIALSMFGGSSNVDRDSPNIFPPAQRRQRCHHSAPAAVQRPPCMPSAPASLCQITHLGRRGDPYAGERSADDRAITDSRDAASQYSEADGRARHRTGDHGLCGRQALRWQARWSSMVSRRWQAVILIGQFLSPVTNRRTRPLRRLTGKTGSRFALMVHEGDSARLSATIFLVGMRFRGRRGSRWRSSLRRLRAHRPTPEERPGAVDFFNAIYGTMDTTRGARRGEYAGYGLAARAPGSSRSVPSAGRLACRYFTLHALPTSRRRALPYEKAKLDMAGMTRGPDCRPPISSRRWQVGGESEIRPCVGANPLPVAPTARPACTIRRPGREQVFKHLIPKGRRAGNAMWS